MSFSAFRQDSLALGASGTGQIGATRPRCKHAASVLFGLLDAVPEPITVHVRRPMFIRDIFAGEPRDSPRRRPTAVPGYRGSAGTTTHC